MSSSAHSGYPPLTSEKEERYTSVPFSDHGGHSRRRSNGSIHSTRSSSFEAANGSNGYEYLGGHPSHGSGRASPRKQHRRLAILSIVFAALLLLFSLHSNSANNPSSSASSSSSLAKDLKAHVDTGLQWAGLKKQKRITLIGMWSDDYLASYLPSMFRSARNQADAVDLLWINVKRKSDQCLDVSPYVKGATNIKTVCITDAENKAMIRDYFCKGWKCTPEQVALVDAHLKDRRDGIHVEFKPWRGGIYKKWIKTSWWAWIDTDQIIGDFKAMWPWNEVDNFDMITISEWDAGNIYLRGQFTAFKDNEKMNKIWLDYEPLKKPENLHSLPTGVPDEFEYSVLYSNIFKSVNWVMFPRVLGADKFGANKVVSHGKKSYYVPAEMSHREIAMLFDTRHTLPSEPVFGVVNSFDPERYGVPLREFRHGDFVDGQPLGPWCDQAETRCTVLREDFFYKTMIMRWDGELLEYFDRRSRPRARNFAGYFDIEEKLFLHWQEIKRRDWFDMPSMGVGDDDVFEMTWNNVMTFNIHTLEETFKAGPPDSDYTVPRELYAMGYRTFNDSGALPLPSGVLADRALIPSQ